MIESVPARRVWLGLGANQGDRVKNLRKGIDCLVEGGVFVDSVSSVYDTEPWGVMPDGKAQPRFANIVVTGLCELVALGLLALCKSIEMRTGRDLDAPRNSPRPLDIDILLIEREIVRSAELEVPHPRMRDRAFVLIPLAEVGLVSSQAGLKEPLTDLLAGVDCSEVRMLEPSGWWHHPGATNSD